MGEIDFIGVGAPRCATTWLAQCLMEHPDICFPYAKELNYFSRTRAGNTKSEYSMQGIKGYLNLFKNCGKDKKKGEYSTYYLVDLEVAGIIKKHFPKAKIIISLRNPIDRAYSDYKNVRFFHLNERKNFEDAFFSKKGLDSYDSRGMYFEQVKKYLDFFPKKNIKIILHEEINKDSKKVIRELYKFLEVDEKFVPESLNKMVNTEAETKVKSLKTFVNILANFYRFFERIGFGKLLSFIKRKTRINEILWKMQQSNKNEKEPVKGGNELTPELRKKLLKIYIKDIEKLEKLIKRDLSAWKC